MKEIIDKDKFINGVLSNLKRKDRDGFNKVDIKPVEIQGDLKLQFTYNYKEKVIHENLDYDLGINKIEELLDQNFRQGVFFTKDEDIHLLISKKGRRTILRKKPSKEDIEISHNRRKNYILEDGEEIDFLIRLGVMNEKGQVVKRRYDKFKQLNRFLELVADIIPKLKTGKKLNIIDFGCGKSYLTFGLYYYLVNILNLEVNIIGLDLKKDVIDFCNKVSQDLNYKGLKFIHGDIKDFDHIDRVDLVVTLHACDTATDEALAKAIKWEAQAILSVPCCQHEFYDKIDNKVLAPMLKHGIVKEKLASLVTDSLRGNILEILGYEVQLLEFIDMEHTPKNILIRAVKVDNKDNKSAIQAYLKFKDFWQLDDLYIEAILGDLLEKELKDDEID